MNTEERSEVVDLGPGVYRIKDIAQFEMTRDKKVIIRVRAKCQPLEVAKRAEKE